MDGWVVMIRPPPSLVDSPDEDRWAEGRRSPRGEEEEGVGIGIQMGGPVERLPFNWFPWSVGPIR